MVYLRYMKTFAEKRDNTDKDLQMFIRSARRSGALPDSWDDIARSAERSWKSHRQNQWR